jgi:hypothetical protein
MEKNLQIYIFPPTQMLSSDRMAGRRTGSRGNLLARNYLTQRLGQIGVQPFFGDGLVGYGQPFSYFFNNGTAQLGPIPGVNLISLVPGKAGNNVIVISAHYDHLGIFKGDLYYRNSNELSFTKSGISFLAPNLFLATKDNIYFFPLFRRQNLQRSR